MTASPDHGSVAGIVERTRLESRRKPARLVVLDSIASVWGTRGENGTTTVWFTVSDDASGSGQDRPAVPDDAVPDDNRFRY